MVHKTSKWPIKLIETRIPEGGTGNVSNSEHSLQDNVPTGVPEQGAAPARAGAPAANGARAPEIDAEQLEKFGQLRQQLQTSFAKVVMTMMATPRYKHCSLAELEHLVLDPLLRGQIAIAQAKGQVGAARSQDDAVVGIAIWAKVSPDVDAKIREQIKAGVFPIRLTAQDWASGDVAWLLDVIAPNQRLAAAVLASFKQVAGDGRLLVHPAVRRLVDAELAPAG